MKTTDVQAIILSEPPSRIAVDSGDGSQDTVIIKVHTDEGIIGVGEVDSAPYVVKAIVESPASHGTCWGLRQLLIGQDPFEIESLWDQMYRRTLYYGRCGVAIHAISGVDIALWDLKGKAAGEPICQLLGGGKRDRVKAYASVLMPSTVAEAERLVSECLEKGFQAIKLGWGPLGDDLVKGEKLIRAARKTLSTL